MKNLLILLLIAIFGFFSSFQPDKLLEKKIANDISITLGIKDYKDASNYNLIVKLKNESEEALNFKWSIADLFYFGKDIEKARADIYFCSNKKGNCEKLKTNPKNILPLSQKEILHISSKETVEKIINVGEIWGETIPLHDLVYFKYYNPSISLEDFMSLPTNLPQIQNTPQPSVNEQEEQYNENAQEILLILSRKLKNRPLRDSIPFLDYEKAVLNSKAKEDWKTITSSIEASLHGKLAFKNNSEKIPFKLALNTKQPITDIDKYAYSLSTDYKICINTIKDVYSLKFPLVKSNEKEYLLISFNKPKQMLDFSELYFGDTLTGLGLDTAGNIKDINAIISSKDMIEVDKKNEY